MVGLSRLSLLIWCGVLISFAASSEQGSDWKTVEDEMKFEYNLKRDPIQLKTNFQCNSCDQILTIKVFDVDSNNRRDIAWTFEDYSHRIGHCSSWFKQQFSDISADREKIWTVVYEEGEYQSRIKFLCNHVIVLDFVIADSIGNSECEKMWQMDTSWMEIEIGELAVEYRTAPGGCTSLLQSWKHVVLAAEGELSWPISYGSSVEVSCEENYFQAGDNVVTCVGEDQFIGQPKCSKIKAPYMKLHIWSWLKR
ncbi:hypothetical protein ACHWQZ_G000867 [Mnemiopsis leidyi]